MARLSDLRTDVIPYAKVIHELARLAGLNPVVTSTVRTYARQAELYRKWKAGLSRFPAAKPGTSRHERGVAFDMDVDDEAALTLLGAIWEGFGPKFVWGGRFKDPIHFEFRG